MIDRVDCLPMLARTIVITGASSGIGAAAAREFAARGARVVLLARRQDALNAVAAECGSDCLVLVADMTRREDVRRAVRLAIDHFGQVDVWVNNAGVGITRQPSQLTDEDVFQMVRSNVLTALHGMQEVLPHFKERGHGHVINVSSILGRIPYAVHRSAYNAAKHFLNAITSNFRDEVHATHPNIHVTLFSPGGVVTEFGRNALHGGPLSSSLPDTQSPEEIALVLASIIKNPRSDVYSREGMRGRVVDYYASTGEDPEG